MERQLETANSTIEFLHKQLEKAQADAEKAVTKTVEMEAELKSLQLKS